MVPVYRISWNVLLLGKIMFLVDTISTSNKRFLLWKYMELTDYSHFTYASCWFFLS
jgi:hypothetical protein